MSTMDISAKCAASGTTIAAGSATTHKVSVQAAMSCTDADKVLADNDGTEAFNTAFKQQMSGVTLSPTKLRKFGCRRLKDGARKLSTTGIKADFEYTTTSNQPKQLDTTAFKTAVNTELYLAGLPETTGVTAVMPSSSTQPSTETVSSAKKTQVLCIALTSLLIAMAWC